MVPHIQEYKLLRLSLLTAGQLGKKTKNKKLIHQRIAVAAIHLYVNFLIYLTIQVCQGFFSLCFIQKPILS